MSGITAEQLKFGATVIQRRVEELIAENGIEGVRVEWQVEEGWEGLPVSAVLLISGAGEPLRPVFSREAIADYPGGVDIQMTESLIILMMNLLRKQK